jgi:hypothetical protein
MSVETINVPVKAHRRTARRSELAWVVWRQHRGLLAASTVAVALFSALLVLAAVQLHGVHCASADQCVLNHHRLFTASRWLLTASVFGFPTAIGAFWGAPLVAREFETGTYTLTFGQDLSPRQWLVGKAAVLGGLAGGLGLVLWIPARMAVDQLARVAPSVIGFTRFSQLPFATLAPMLVVFALFALAVGVLASSGLRRTLPALAITLVSVPLLLLTVGHFLRPHYEPPVRSFSPSSADGVKVAPNPLYLAENTWADSSGDVTAFPTACSTSVDFVSCLAQHGIVRRVSAYQPGSRESTFQGIETSLYALLTTLMLAAAAWTLGRTRVRG